MIGELKSFDDLLAWIAWHAWATFIGEELYYNASYDDFWEAVITDCYPRPCQLCRGVIQSKEDLDWHGYGNCVEITEEMLAQWEREAKEET